MPIRQNTQHLIEVSIWMNPNSGRAFLSNAEFQSAMVNPNSGKLESFYNCPYNGDEGFLDELIDRIEEIEHEEDIEYIISLVEAEQESRGFLEGKAGYIG